MNELADYLAQPATNAHIVALFLIGFTAWAVLLVQLTLLVRNHEHSTDSKDSKAEGRSHNDASANHASTDQESTPSPKSQAVSTPQREA